MSQQKLYVNKPGGALLQHESGEVVSYDYGQPVNVEDLSEAQRKHLAHVTTTSQPSPSLPEPRDAQLDAAMMEATNTNTSASPIPGNYGELSEDQAVRLIQAVSDPASQAVIVAYEMQHANRGKVIAAAPSSVRDEAEVRKVVAEFESEQMNSAPQAPVPAPSADSGGSEWSGDGEDEGGGGETGVEAPGGTLPPPSSGPSSE